MGEYRKAGRRVDVSLGEWVRIIPELQQLTRSQLAEGTDRVAARIGADHGSNSGHLNDRR